MLRTLLLSIGLVVSICCCAQTAEDTLFRFAHISDTHIGNHTAAADLENTIKDLNGQQDIAFVIISGDITEFGSGEELKTARALFDQLKKPWYIVPGNHDTKWSESGGTVFRQIFGSETFSFEHKGWLFIGTNCGPNMRMGPGQVPRENLVWMDSVLRAHPNKQQPVFFVNHYPLDDGLNNWYEVLDRFKERNLKAVLCGHGHRNRKMNFEGIPGIMGRSNLRVKDSVGGYNIVTITSKALYYNERRPGVATMPMWCTVSMEEKVMPQWESNPKRPDYSANDQYKTVKEKWVIQEDADIGSGVGIYKQSLIYTTTGGWIKAVNTANGKLLWSYRTNGKIYATPLVMDQLVVVSGTDGNVYCVNAKNGKLQWSHATGYPIVSSAAGWKDRVIIAGSDGHCRALALQSGKVLWDYDSVNNFVETTPLVNDGKVYFGSWGNVVYALDVQTGKPAWTWKNGHTNRMFSAAACWPVIAGNQLFIVSPDKYMTALNKENGAVIWRQFDSLHFVRESMGIAKDQGQVYVKTMQGKVLAIDATAAERKITWVSPEALGYEICPSPINENNNAVFVPTQSGMVYALQKQDGALMWKHKISNCLINTVQPLNAHTIITSSMDGKLVCLEF